jgi:Zn-dependent protease
MDLIDGLLNQLASLFQNTGLISLLFQKDGVSKFLLVAIPLLFSVIIHELSHGWVANQMGDPTAKWLGRLSLNPLKHLDPIGTIMLFLSGFGWAKPVPVDFRNLRDFRKGLIFVSVAGITANIILATIAIFTLKLLSLSYHDFLYLPLVYMAKVNIMLASFNLIPIPPLDGSKILMGFSSRSFQESLARLEPYGFFIIIFLLWRGWLDPFIYFFQKIILGFINLLLGG